MSRSYLYLYRWTEVCETRIVHFHGSMMWLVYYIDFGRLTKTYPHSLSSEPPWIFVDTTQTLPLIPWYTYLPLDSGIPKSDDFFRFKKDWSHRTFMLISTAWDLWTFYEYPECKESLLKGVKKTVDTYHLFYKETTTK